MQYVADGTIAVLDADEDTFLSRWIERDGTLTAYDPRIERLLCPLIPVGGVVVDVGACLGTHTVPYAKQVGPDGVVWAIEPAPASFACLAANTARYPQVRALRVALTSKRRVLGLEINPHNAGATHVVPLGSAWPRAEQLGIPLDDFQLPVLDYLKVDVEGYELEVLWGAIQTIRRCRPIIVTETGRWLERYRYTPEAMLGFFAANCYDVERLPDERDPGDPTTYDLLCRPR